MAMASQVDSQMIMSHFPKSSTAFTHEYALELVNDSIPFLRKTFEGYHGIEMYMSLMTEYLKYEDMEFFNYAVAEEKEVVTVKGSAKWTYLKTGKKWEETFIWQLSLFVTS